MVQPGIPSNTFRPEIDQALDIKDSCSPVAQEFPSWRQFLPVAGPLDDDLEAGISQPVQSNVSEDGIVEQAKPLVHRAVAGDDEAGDAMSADDQLVEIGGLLGGEPVETQVIQDQQVRCIELPTRAWVITLKKSLA